MTDSFIPYQNPTSTDGKLDAESLTVGAITVLRERVEISGASALEIAAVKAAAPTTEYGLVVRNIPSGTQTVQDTAAEASLSVMDDWDESDRAKVNLIVGQAGIAAGAGAVAATVPRVTLASDDPAVASLGIIDDWDESDRAKVNPIVGQAGVAAGAGAVAATVQRMTLASDDPAVASLSVIDDWDESDRAKVNPIVGQAGVQGNTGVVTATTQRVTLATDVNVPVNLATALSNTIDSISVTGKRATYTCGGNLTPYTTALTVLELSGSGTKTVRLRRLIINLKATSVGNYPISLSKNSVPSSGGTSSTPAIIPLSSGNAAATAVVKQFSAAPTAPTSLGNVRGGNLQITDSDTPTFIGQYVWTFGDLDSQALELLGTGESVSVTCNGLAVPTGASLDYIFEFTEE